MRPARLVSGGQTGADRAALEVGHKLDIPIGGWCPAGGWAEDLTEPPGLLVRFPELRETPSADPSERTTWNVRDSDATLVLDARGVDSPGTAFTIKEAERLGKPVLTCIPGEPASLPAVRAWLAGFGPGLVLNVAGPRESQAPWHQLECTDFLRALFAATPG